MPARSLTAKAITLQGFFYQDVFLPQLYQHGKAIFFQEASETTGKRAKKSVVSDGGEKIHE